MRAMRWGLALALSGLAGVSVLALARDRPAWSLEAALGVSFEVPSPLVIHQDGRPDLRVSARYETRSLKPPLYYRVRLARGREGRTLALDLVHHKMHLLNRPSEVGEFAVSHGWNLLTLSRARRVRDLTVGSGLGLVVAHPENTVRGLRLSERQGLLSSGYYVAGPAGTAFVSREVPIAPGVYVPIELRTTVGWGRVPVAQGEADVRHAALHATIGLGLRTP